jgi:hypothetical protein
MKYRKKPVVIEAMQIKSDNVSSVLQWINGISVSAAGYDDNDMPFITINTLEGKMTGQLGDFIIKGVKGEFYPCKPDIFKLTYEPVKE